MSNNFNLMNEVEQFYIQNKQYLDPLIDVFAQRSSHSGTQDEKSTETLETCELFTSFMDDVFDNKLGSMTDNIRFKLNGHSKQFEGKTLKEAEEDPENNGRFSMQSLKARFIYPIQCFLKSLKKESPYKFLIDTYLGNIELTNRHCEDCGSSLKMVIYTDTMTIELPRDMPHYADACPIAVSTKHSIKGQIEVPSGKLVFANDMRRLIREGYEEIETESNAISHTICYLTEKFMVENLSKRLGMIMCLVSNRSPSVFLENNVITVRQEEEDEADISGLLQGNICTDLWWYCAMDSDKFHLLVKSYDGEFDQDFFEVEVEPGTYEFDHFYNLNTFDGIDTTIKKVN